MASDEDFRGLVVSNPFEMRDGRLQVVSTELDPQQLRGGLLLWDKLAWPTNMVLSIPSGRDELYLERAGALIRPDCTPRLANGRVGEVGDIVNRILMLPADAFDDLERKQPGKWTLAEGNSAQFVAAGRMTAEGGVALELFNAIPIPRKDVPLAEVLEFRQKRRDEYLSLRAEIDHLAAIISDSDAREASLKAAVDKIDKACGVAIRIGSEWQWPIILTSPKISYEVRPAGAASAGLTTFTAATQMGLPTTTAAILALGAAAATTVGSVIKVSGDFGWRGLRRGFGPYRYIAQLHREL